MQFLKKWLSVLLVATLLVSIGNGIYTIEAAPHIGYSYFQSSDNTNQGGTIGGSDGDMDIEISNPLGTNGTNGDKHPIEFNIEVDDLPAEIESAALLIRANDVDEEAGEYDRVFFGPERREIGNLSGNNEVWNTTAFYLEPEMLTEGHHYVEIQVFNRDGNGNISATSNNWVVTIDWGQIVLNNGPKDKIAIDRTNAPSITTPPSNTKYRDVSFTVNPTEPGTYIAEINLLDADGNNVGTIFKEINAPDTTPINLVAEFDGGSHYGSGNPNPIKSGVEYSANVILYTQEIGEAPEDSYNPGSVQDIWASNTPPIVKDIDKGDVGQNLPVSFTQSEFSNQFVNLNGESDVMEKIKIAEAPAHGTLYLNGTPVGKNTEIPAAQLEQLEYVPDAGYLGPDSFQWNGYDGKIYALFPAAVQLNVVEAPRLHKAELADVTPDELVISFTEPIQLTVGDAVYGGFTVGIDEDNDGHPDRPVTVTGSTYGPDDHSVYLYLAEPLLPGDTALVSYDRNHGDVRDLDGNDAISFTNEPVSRIHEPLDGWVGNRAADDLTNIILAPGDPLKISATSSLLADNVTVTLFGEVIELTEVTSPGAVGYKEWAYVNYHLPVDAAGQAYTAAFASYEGNSSLPAEEYTANNVYHVVDSIDLQGVVTDSSTGEPIANATVTLYDAAGSAVITDPATDEPFTVQTAADGSYLLNDIPTGTVQIVVEQDGYGSQNRIVRALPTNLGDSTITEDFALAPFSIHLTANPSAIVGDGVSTSMLTAQLLDVDGNPLPNTEVTFSAPAGTFENGTGTVTVTTDEEGKAVVSYTSEVIEGLLTQNIPVTATVNDGDLQGEAQIIVSFQPAQIFGVITDMIDDQEVPVAGTVVKVTKDFNGDGKIDFSAQTITDENGYYSVAVPRGGANVEYDVTITKQVQAIVDSVETTIEVPFTQKAPVGTFDATGQSFESNKTATGIVGMSVPNQADTMQMIQDPAMLGKLNVYLKDPVTGLYVEEAGVPKAFPLQDSGVFHADGLTAGSYQVELKYEFEADGHTYGIILNENREDQSLPTITVDEDGEMSIVQMLVDPYGTVTDGRTGEVIEDATVTLYYADTVRNVGKGNTPHTEVILPAIPGFAPNDNESPVQLTDLNGLYAYMVFPESDYYLTVEKAGYRSYTSPTIEVEWAIVKHDVQLYRRSSGGGGVYIPPAEADLSLNLSVDKNIVEEGTTSTITVAYTNNSYMPLQEGLIQVTLPEGAEVIDADGAEVDGRVLSWTVENVASRSDSTFEIKVKWPQLSEQEASFDVEGVFTAETLSDEAAESNSEVKVNVFSNRYDNLQHTRYIFGYPDGQFKPLRSLTRAELAAIVARLTENEQILTVLDYTDVPETHWAANYIKIVTKHGYFTGFSDGTFRPDQEITRAELASVMARFLDLQFDASSELQFTDTSNHWAKDAIEALYNNKFVAGYPDDTFKPNQAIRRSEAVTLINRMLYRGPLRGLEPLFPDVPAEHWAFGDVQEATSSHESVRNMDGSETWVDEIEDNVK